MCGRFTLRTPLQRLVEQFLFDLQPADLPPRFNIAPTQRVSAVRVLDPVRGREYAQLHWGLIPSWATERAIASRLINARSETVAEKPAFRRAFRQRRCLVLADGYYEWQKTDVPGRKQPYYIRLRDDRPFGLAGLWETWQDPDGTRLETCTIITTAANELTRPIHPRMPVILAPHDYTDWLDPRAADRAVLTRLLRPYAATAMEAYPVSTSVNNPRHDAPDCVVPAPPAAGQRQLGFS
jgi:putative SOS response-associated peptidase YedK